MKTSLSASFLIMIAVQAIHAVEEFAFEFWEAFPPMRSVYGGVDGLGERVFVLFHTLLVGFGLWCYLRWVRPGGEHAHALVRLWIWIQSVTVLLHVAWFLTGFGYQPGIATTPLFVPAIVLGAAALRREELSLFSGESGEA